MDKLTREQREQEILIFEIQQKKRLQAGGMIIVSIASINIILSILSCIANFNILSLIIQIALSIALMSGVTWVRYVFAVGAALNSFITIYSLAMASAQAPLPGWVIIVICIQLAYSIASCILLFASKAVGDYMYAKKNG